MRLKKIEIVGFKSFADRIVLTFTQGITGVVGPNGCGKSNIADAFRWVLGEQSAKSMRGIKMHDVIFAGTSTRKPLNYAEVTITFTDVGGDLNTEYEEIAVTRRLHRSGESEYLINKQPARLKDIQGMFMDSGIGKDAFSIFEQGKIDEVINLSPTDRRSIFEEAAGIGRFLMRKNEAKRKLDQTEQNLVRLRDIDREVEKQLNVLEKQSEKARTYKDRKILLESLEKAVLVGKWEVLHQKWETAQNRSQELQKQIDALNQTLDALQQKHGTVKTGVADTEDHLKAKQEELYQLRSIRDVRQKEVQTCEERLKEAKQKEQQYKQDLVDLKNRTTQLQTEQQEGQVKIKKMEKELSEWESKLHAQREAAQALDTELGKLRENQFKANQERVKAVQAEHHADSERKQAQIRLEGFQEKHEKLEARRTELDRLMKEYEKQSAEKKKAMTTLSQAIDERKAELRHAENLLKDFSQEIQKKQTEWEALQKDVTEAKARQKVLWRLREEMQGFSAGSKKLLQEAQKPQSPLYQKIQAIYEIVNTEQGHESTLAAAMRPYLQTLVVKTKADLATVLEFAEKNSIKDFSLFCLETLPKKAEQPAAPAKAKSLLKRNADPVSRHFLSSIFETESINHALDACREGEWELCTPQGIFVDHRKVIFFAIQGEGNVFTREAELKTLETQIAEKEKSVARFETLLKEVQNKKQDQHNRHSELDRTIRKEEMHLVEANFALQKAISDLEKARNEHKQVAIDLQGISEHTAKWKQELEQAEAKYQEAKKKAAESQQLANQLDQDYEKQQVAYKVKNRDYKEQENAYHQLLEQHQKLVYHLNILNVREQECQTQQQKTSQEQIDSISRQQEIVQAKEQFQTAIKEVDAQLKEMHAGCHELELLVKKQKKELDSSDDESTKIRQQQKKLEAEHYQVGNQLGQHTSTIKTLEDEIVERYHLTIQEAIEKGFKLEKGLPESEKQLKAMRHDLEEMGDVNMTAIEECEQHRQRHEFLYSQIGDMDHSKQELLAIIAGLDEECRKMFKETFEKIRVNFQKNFQILFNGGEADLQFTESQDVLTAGVEITAKPPGKQMRSITLLSGGEKCMTAMALLFAIFEVKPAPFCILDEMDAPLDDSNIERFVNVLKQFLEHCQFVIITHNKRTMAIADVLYGVSMQEKGVSKILSMEFAKSPSPSLV